MRFTKCEIGRHGLRLIAAPERRNSPHVIFGFKAFLILLDIVHCHNTLNIVNFSGTLISSSSWKVRLLPFVWMVVGK